MAPGDESRGHPFGTSCITPVASRRSRRPSAPSPVALLPEGTGDLERQPPTLPLADSDEYTDGVESSAPSVLVAPYASALARIVRSSARTAGSAKATSPVAAMSAPEMANQGATPYRSASGPANTSPTGDTSIVIVM